MAKREDFERLRTDVWESNGWQEFRRFRAQEWDKLIQRRAPTSLNPAAMQFLQATNAAVDIQSPDLEKDLHDRVSVLLSNSARIDAISLDGHVKAKEDVEDIRIWSAARWLADNEENEITRAVYEQMCRYGVAVARKGWRMIEEPDKPDDRDAYYAEHVNEMFSYHYLSPLELAWAPLTKPRCYVQESVITYPEARKLRQNKDGGALRMYKRDGKDHLLFADGNTPTDEIVPDDWGGKKIYLTVVAEKDEEGVWHVAEWVRCAENQTADALELDEYVCPFKEGPYPIAPGGDELVTESNPHLRYRPMIYPLLVDVQELNALVTLLVMTTVWHLQNPFYVRLDGLNPQLASSIDGLANDGYGVIEGSGAERKFIFHMPDPGSGEVMAAPRLEQMPNANLPDAFMLRIQQVQENIMGHRANRYLTGDAMDATREQPATSTLNQAEAAATPFGTYLQNGDRFIKRWLLAEHEAIVYWAGDKPYPIRVRGDEPVSKQREAGEEVTISAEKLKRPYVLQVITRNETQAEHALNQQLADVAYEKGRITEEQWLRQCGSDDPQKQMDDLWKDQERKYFDLKYQSVYDKAMETLMRALTGLSEMFFMPSPGDVAPPADSTGGGGGTEMPKRGVHAGTAPVVESASGGAGMGNGGTPGQAGM